MPPNGGHDQILQDYCENARRWRNRMNKLVIMIIVDFVLDRLRNRNKSK